MGFAFVVYYIFRASEDVVASDYIRIINYYLIDVKDLKYLFSIGSISRIPFTFLARFINVVWFKYSTYFDRILGVTGLFILNINVLKYIQNTIQNKKLKDISIIITTFIVFSLMSWELILNGTGYAHFISIGLFSIAIIYLADIDNIKSQICFILLMIITAIFFAAQYIVAFAFTSIFFAIIYLIRDIVIKTNNKKLIFIRILNIITASFCIVLYFVSDKIAGSITPVGFKETTLLEVIKENPIFPIKFILKSLASAIIGVETFQYALNFNTINENVILFVGFIYLLVVIFTLVVTISNIKTAIKNKSKLDLVPIIFIMYGLINFMLVFFARYKFVRDDYGMSSRYSIQYMFLTIGIVITLFKYIDDKFNIKNKMSKNIVSFISILCIFFITLGHITTIEDEIFKADYRKILYKNLENIAVNYEEYNDEELENAFEYRRGVDQIKDALNILKNQKLNVFR